MADGALRAADRVRAVKLDAVESDEQAAAEAFERGEGTLLADGAETEGEQFGEAVGVHTVKQIADPRLSQGMACTPKSVWQLEREVSACMRRWNSRKEGAWKKKTARAQEAASAGVALVAARRESGCEAPARRKAASRPSRTFSILHVLTEGSPCINCDRPRTSRPSIWRTPKLRIAGIARAGLLEGSGQRDFGVISDLRAAGSELPVGQGCIATTPFCRAHRPAAR